MRQRTHVARGLSSAHTAVRSGLTRRAVSELYDQNEQEVLGFLSIRPVHTVVMASFIMDNGIENPLNRGKFYGYRNTEGTLEGVALIGHTTLVEARSENALKALARKARASEVPMHMIMSDGTNARQFWSYTSQGESSPRLVCEELLFETDRSAPLETSGIKIRSATKKELGLVAQAQAEIALMESGTDPMHRDPEGFLARVGRRIEQGRVFVAFEKGKLIFKADIIAESAGVIYLEGIYVAPSHRGKGIGSACLAELTRKLLSRAGHVTLLSNISFTEAHRSYQNAGFTNTGRCLSLFV